MVGVRDVKPLCCRECRDIRSLGPCIEAWLIAPSTDRIKWAERKEKTDAGKSG